MKYVNSQSSNKFRDHFKAKNKAGFICRANTFDNVNGNFPIGFLIWDLGSKQEISKIEVDVMVANNDINAYRHAGVKAFHPSQKGTFIIDWLRRYFDKKSEKIGYLRIQGTDIQQNNTIFVTSKPSDSDFRESKVTEITQNNLIETSIYFTLRNIIEGTWLNDRDQYLYPNDSWRRDTDFQNNCLAYTLFNNKIQSQHGVNHWIPFTEKEINAKEKFASNFMSKFIQGKIKPEEKVDLLTVNEPQTHYDAALKFSPEATAVFDAGRALWTYYHAQPKCNVNASLYDIREHFQGRNDKGKMNNKSTDAVYSSHIAALRSKLKLLAQKIEPKVYEHGFLL